MTEPLSSNAASLLPVLAPIGGAIAAGLSACFYGMFSPTSQMFAPVILRGPRECENRVAITFDDGPTPEGTGPILDTLEQLSARATFFCIGANIEKHPDLVRRAVRSGHQIENHSFDHAWSGLMRRGWYWKDQWRRTDEAIAAAGGPERCRYFRPPMGFKSWRMTLAARAEGYHLVAWSLRGLDGVSSTSESILGRLLPRVQAGDIIALHDGSDPGFTRDPRATIEALPRLIHTLHERGLKPVTLDDLLTPASADAAGAQTTSPAV